MGTWAVTTAGLTKRFGAQRGITDVTLQVAPGQVFGFLGPNGAGKSTTIRLLLGLCHPTEGSALVLDLDPDRGRDRVELMRRVGYLPGELALFGRLTGQEILDRFARARGLTDLSERERLVDRFGAELDRPVRTLSKGNRQKVGLVLAFQHEPELLILDEPTSGLDPLLQGEFARLLEEIVAQGRTVFLSSHDLVEVQRVVHQLAVIREGRVVASDTVEGLRGRAPRVIELEFPDPPDPSVYAALPGVRVRAADGRRLDLAVTGAVAPVLERLHATPCATSSPGRRTWTSSSSASTRTRRDPMALDVSRLDLRVRRRTPIGCVLGTAAYAFLIVALYPAFRDDASLDSMTKNNPTLAALFGATGSITSVTGWLNANLYANFLPLIALLLTIGYGAAAIAGQDEEGSLGLITTLPLTRNAILLQKVLALGVLAFVVPASVIVALLPGPSLGLSPDWPGVVTITATTTLLAWDFGLLALLVGAATGNRGLALAVSTSAAAASYLVGSLAPVVTWVSAIRWTSPFYWAVGRDQIAGAARPWTDLTVLLGLGVVLVMLGLRAFQRLDLH